MAKFGAPGAPGTGDVPSRIVVMWVVVVVVTVDELDPGVKERVAVVVVVDPLFSGDGNDGGAVLDEGEEGLRLENGLRGAVVGLTAGGRMTRWNVYASSGVS